MRYLILSDIHSNIEALSVVLEECESTVVPLKKKLECSPEFRVSGKVHPACGIQAAMAQHERRNQRFQLALIAHDHNVLVVSRVLGKHAQVQHGTRAEEAAAKIGTADDACCVHCSAVASDST